MKQALVDALAETLFDSGRRAPGLKTCRHCPVLGCQWWRHESVSQEVRDLLHHYEVPTPMELRRYAEWLCEQVVVHKLEFPAPLNNYQADLRRKAERRQRDRARKLRRELAAMNEEDRALREEQDKRWREAVADGRAVPPEVPADPELVRLQENLLRVQQACETESEKGST